MEEKTLAKTAKNIIQTTKPINSNIRSLTPNHWRAIEHHDKEFKIAARTFANSHIFHIEDLQKIPNSILLRSYNSWLAAKSVRKTTERKIQVDNLLRARGLLAF